MPSSSPVVVLDIGASKVHCLVGETGPDGDCRILGVGISPCRGIRRSAIIDMPRVVESIRNAVAEAERAAGLRITGAYAGIAGQDVQAHCSRSAVAISGSSEPIDERDVERALAAAEQAAPPAQAVALHRFVQSYAVDGEPVQNPLWLHGHKLEVETLSATASEHACTTLRRAAGEAGVDIVGFLVESVATASAMLGTDEREMGVGLLDMGAGTCDLALYHGSLRHLAEIPFGGQDITRDLSMVLNISSREAEQLKCEHGGVCTEDTEADEALTFRTTAGRSHTILRDQLDAIIEARQQEILEFVGREVERSGQGHMLAAGMVFTGGGALLRNVDRLGEDVLGLPVRIGEPCEMISPNAVQSPAHATGVGLLRFASDASEQLAPTLQPAGGGSRPRLMDRVARLFSFL
ncbi:MAG: cell division protein FtsA [Candidatus Latescibacterota bacterium]